MQKSPRYEVQTKYGWFSLDEGAYRDYMAGKLWITWPQETMVVKSVDEAMPRNISVEAISLRDEANLNGVYATAVKYNEDIQVRVPNVRRFVDYGIEELSLSVRSSNGLMRAGINTFGKLAAAIDREGGLFAIRNLGTKSEREIRMAFIEECYQRMTPYEKAEYWQAFLEEKVKVLCEK